MPNRTNMRGPDESNDGPVFRAEAFACTVTVKDLNGNVVDPAVVHLEPRQSGLNAHDGSANGTNGVATINVDYNGYYDIEASGGGKDGIDQRKNVSSSNPNHTIYID